MTAAGSPAPGSDQSPSILPPGPGKSTAVTVRAADREGSTGADLQLRGPKLRGKSGVFGYECLRYTRTAQASNPASRRSSRGNPRREGNRARPESDRASGHVPPDLPLAQDGRRGDQAQEAEPDLLPDLGRGSRSRARRRGQGPEERLRLVLSVLPRPGADAHARDDADGDAPRGGGRRRGSQLGRTADARALGSEALERGHPVQPHRHAVPPGRGLLGGRTDALRPQGRQEPPALPS